MTGSALSTGWWSGWIRCSWSVVTGAAAVRAVGFPPSPASDGARGRPPVVSVRDEDGRLPTSAIPVDPRARAPAARERDGGSATTEIVPFLAIEHREKLGIVQLVDLAADVADTVDQPGIAAEIDQSSADAALADERRGRREHAMQRVAAQQRPVREQEPRGFGMVRAGWPGLLRRAEVLFRSRQGVSTAWSTAPRKSRSGTAPSNCTRSLITTFGTPITLYARDSSGNSVASMTVERTRSDATDMCCARRTARGQCGQVGVENTLMSTSDASARSDARVSSLSAGTPVEATMIESIRLLNS